MSISFVGAASAEATSLTLPTHQAGDVLFVFPLRIGAGGAMVTPAVGWLTSGNTVFVGGSGNISAFWKIAESSSEMSGAWGNANLLLAAVYRISNRRIFAPFRNSTRNASTTTINYPAKSSLAATQTGASNANMASENSWVIGLAATTSIAVSLTSPPSGMSHRASVLGASSGQIVLHDTNADVSSWASTNVTASSAIEYASMTIDLPTIPVPSGGSSRPVSPFMQQVIG